MNAGNTGRFSARISGVSKVVRFHVLSEKKIPSREEVLDMVKDIFSTIVCMNRESRRVLRIAQIWVSSFISPTQMPRTRISRQTAKMLLNLSRIRNTARTRALLPERSTFDRHKFIRTSAKTTASCSVAIF